jgi:hypothetical protein
MTTFQFKPLSEVKKEVDESMRQERLAPRQKWQSPQEQYARVLEYFKKYHAVTTWEEIQKIQGHRYILEGFLNETQHLTDLISWMNHIEWKKQNPPKKRKKRRRSHSSGMPSSSFNYARQVVGDDIAKDCDEYCCCLQCLHK